MQRIEPLDHMTSLRIAMTLLFGAALLGAPAQAAAEQGAPQGVPPAPQRTTQQAPPDYVIGVNDVLSIVVFNETKLSSKYQVGADGTFAFPYLDRVKAAGLTARQVEDNIREGLGKDGKKVLVNPQVSVTVEGFRSQQITILGPVAKPGSYEFTGKMDVLQLLSLAGGLTDKAGPEALIVRDDGGKSPAAERLKPGGGPETVNLLALRKGDFSQNLPLYSGDRLLVQDPKKFHIEGHVARPGAFDYRAGLTVRTALSEAGGIVEPGSERRLQIIRKVDGKETALDVKMSDPVEPDDIIKVRPGFF